MAALTRDFHSAARWEQFVEAFFQTRQGEDALIRICKGLRERITEQRAPGNPGAWLNSALLKTAVELGISVERKNGAVAHAGQVPARRSG